jgi:hypothetical protein
VYGDGTPEPLTDHEYGAAALLATPAFVRLLELDEERLALALNRIGAADIEEMAWSPLRHPIEFEGNPELNIHRDDPYPMASLSAAIITEYRRLAVHEEEARP